MPKNKTHKGIMKRVRITKSGKVKHPRPFRSHKRSSKRPKRLRRLRKGLYASSAETKRMKALLFRKLRGRNTPLTRTASKAAPVETPTASED
jgi:large subunit ribosomal protein L35